MHAMPRSARPLPSVPSIPKGGVSLRGAPRCGNKRGGQDTRRGFGGRIPGGCTSWAWHEAKMASRCASRDYATTWARPHPIESLDSAECAVSRGRDLELRAVRMVVSASSSSLDTQGSSGHQWTGTIIPWHGTYPGHREPGTLISWRGAPRCRNTPQGGGREGGIADTTVVMTTAAPRCVLLHHGLKTASHFPPELCEIKTGVQVAGGPIPPDPTSPLRWGACRVD